MSEALKVYDQAGAELGTIDMRDELLCREKGKRILHEAVLGHLAARRAGTASTKEKGEVAGTGARPWRQKGTGRARAGYKQSPVWRGGGVAFGPKPRDYAVKMNKRERRLAFKRAFTQRVLAGDVRVLEALAVEDGKTRSLAGILKSLDVQRGALVIVDNLDPMLAQASRNIQRVEVAAASQVHTYQMMRYPVVLVTKAGMVELEKRLIGEQAS